MREKIDERIEKTISDWSTPFEDKASSWEGISQRLDQEAGKEVKMWPKLAAIAASVVLLVALFFMNREVEQSYETLAQQLETVTLPDGSIASLNAGSTLIFDENWSDGRFVQLTGEAFFSVEKGSRFEVSTDNGSVEVLGTSFNVYSRADELKVACKTGRVKVSTEIDEVILTPGLATDSDSGDLKEPYTREHADAWTRGEFHFDNEPIGLVIEELERQFGVNIDSPVGVSARFSGEFSVEDLETALMVVCGPMGLNYDIQEEGKVIITQN